MHSTDTPGSGDLLRRVAAVTHEHLAPVRVVESGAGQADLARVGAPGPTLAALLAERGVVSPGECVTVLVPVARAVAAVHAAGLLVDGLAPADVQLDGTGRPLLVLPRLPSAAVPVRRPGTCAEPWDADVRDLGRLGWTMLTGTPPDGQEESLLERLPGAPRALLGLVTAVLDAPAGALPSAAELATAILAACPPEPVRLPAAWATRSGAEASADGPLVQAENEGGSSAGRPRPVRRGADRAASGGQRRARSGGSRRARSGGSQRAPSGGRRRRSRIRLQGRALVRRASLVVAGALALAVTSLAVLAAGRASVFKGFVAQPVTARIAAQANERVGTSSAAPSPSASSGTSDWRAVLTELDRSRAAALERSGLPALARVDVAGSPAYARDQAIVAAYARQGAHVQGLRTELVSVTPRLEGAVYPGAVTSASEATAVRLLVRDRRAAYDVVSADGRRVRRPARDVCAWAVELRSVDGAWRIWDVAAASDSAAS